MKELIAAIYAAYLAEGIAPTRVTVIGEPAQVTCTSGPQHQAARAQAILKRLVAQGVSGARVERRQVIGPVQNSVLYALVIATGN